MRKTDKTAALHEFAVAAKLAPDNARYAYVYAIGLNSAGKQREALAILKAAEALSNNKEIKQLITEVGGVK